MSVSITDELTRSLIFPDSKEKPVKGSAHNPTSSWSGLHIHPITHRGVRAHTPGVCLFFVCAYVLKKLGQKCGFTFIFEVIIVIADRSLKSL